MKGFVILISICLCSMFSKAQGVFDYYISNGGNDANTGIAKQFPKKTIAGVATTVANGSLPVSRLAIGLKGGDIFNETFYPGFPVKAGTYFANESEKKFAILNGTDVFDNGWVSTSGAVNTYEQAIPLSGFTGYGINNVGQYSMVTVFEIDRVLEQTAPFTARKPLVFVASLQAADTIPGSFYQPVTVNINPKTIYIHTSDGSSPNNHPKYRYEVTVRDRAINSTYQQGNYFEKLWVRGYGAGNGMIPAGANTVFNRMIFGPGAGIHHLGLRGATINNSLFLPGAKNTSEYAVVFYDVEGFRRRNMISNSIFLDIRYPLYTHTSYGASFGSLVLNNVIAFADTSHVESFLESSNTDTVSFNNVYTYRYKSAYHYGKAKYLSIQNSYFVDVNEGIGIGFGNSMVNITNTFIRISGNHLSFGVSTSDSSRLTISNSILHYKNHAPVASGQQLLGSFLFGYAGVGSNINSRGNIFICEVNPENSVLAATSSINQLGLTNDRWQNNVFILLSGNSIKWRILENGRPQFQGFDQWRQRTGQDRTSLFIDLRNDPRGLKAIFVDPDNGDYSLANTVEGNRIRKLRAGMVIPISCFLKKPTYEEAAEIIMNDGVLTPYACRNPCVQKNIRISHNFNETLLPGKKIQLQWNIEDERSVDHYEIVRSFGNSDFINIGSVNAADKANYTFIDSNIMPGITYRYSLVVVTRLLEKCYSEVRAIKTEDGKAVTVFPNPSSGIIQLSLNSYTGPVKISITNVLGITVFSKELTSIYGLPVQINLSNQSKGFYWLKVQTDKEHVIQPLLLK